MKPLAFPEALRRARMLIESGKETYICYALENVHGNAGSTQKRTSVHMGLISELLQDRVTYEGWLAAYHYDAYKAMRVTPGAFRQGRLQWIDHMLETGYGRGK